MNYIVCDKDLNIVLETTNKVEAIELGDNIEGMVVQEDGTCIFISNKNASLIWKNMSKIF